MKWENEVEKALRREGPLTIDRLLDIISPQYAKYEAAIRTTLVSMRDYGAYLAATDPNADLLPKLRTLTANLSMFWLNGDDPASETEYLNAFDRAVRHAAESGQAPEPTQQMIVNIYDGLDLTVAEMSDCGDMEEGIRECEDLRVSLSEIWEPQTGGPTLG